MTTCCAALVAAALLLALGGPASAERYPRPGDHPIDRAEECLEATPAAHQVPAAPGYAEEISLEVHVVLDGMPLDRGMAVMERVAGVYQPINVKVVPTFEEVVFEPEKYVGDIPTSTSRHMFTQLKEHLGGTRPWGSDVVYLMTTTEIDGTVAGQADCIGGVRYPNRAFAIGEALADASREKDGSIVRSGHSAKIASHEIAHLLGAHHHYANCAEGEKAALLRGEPTPCTLMFNDLFFVSLQLSTVNSSIVRGHAVKFAKDTPVGPPPPVARNIVASVEGETVRGRVRAPGNSYCENTVTVTLERKGARKWQPIGDATTSETGSFDFETHLEPGSYRVVALETEENTARATVVCGYAKSATMTKR